MPIEPRKQLSEMNAVLKLAQILLFVLFLSFHTVSDIQQGLAHTPRPSESLCACRVDGEESRVG